MISIPASWTLLLSATVFLGTGGAGCFYNEVINEEPQPGIRTKSPGLHYIGDTLIFDATKSVDDDLELVVEWRAFSCEEGRTPRCLKIAELDDNSFNSVATEFFVSVESHETIEVQLQVKDRYGAFPLTPDRVTINISNRDPVIDMQILGNREAVDGPFVLSRDIHFIARSLAKSMNEEILTEELIDLDGDETELTWELLPPVGSLAEARIFEPEGENGYVLIPDVSGEWSIVLRSEDGFGGVDEIRQNFFVGVDGPPCLDVLDPRAIDDSYYPLDSLDGARRFSVLSVVDALDPFPFPGDSDPVFGETRFQWFLQSPGDVAFIPIQGHVASSYVVDPSVYQPGEQLALRVEVYDRVVGPERELPCAEDVWSCALSTGSECFQRVTWGVEIR